VSQRDHFSDFLDKSNRIHRSTQTLHSSKVVINIDWLFDWTARGHHASF
jgi:hypothetical protein